MRLHIISTLPLTPPQGYGVHTSGEIKTPPLAPPPSGDASGTLRGKRSHARRALHQSPTVENPPATLVHRKRGGEPDFWLNLVFRAGNPFWIRMCVHGSTREEVNWIYS